MQLLAFFATEYELGALKKVDRYQDFAAIKHVLTALSLQSVCGGTDTSGMRLVSGSFPQVFIYLGMAEETLRLIFCLCTSASIEQLVSFQTYLARCFIHNLDIGIYGPIGMFMFMTDLVPKQQKLTETIEVEHSG